MQQSRFTRDGVEVLTNARVKEIRSDRVLFSQMEDGKAIIKEIPTAFCLWSTGVGKHILDCLVMKMLTSNAQSVQPAPRSPKLSPTNWRDRTTSMPLKLTLTSV